MKITLDANPSNAPCCVRIEAENGKDLLIQTDWDYPGIASTFGWSIKCVENTPPCYDDWKYGGEVTEEENAACLAFEARQPCSHSGTDGTVDCPECGVKASQFITAARQWIDDNDGAETEDPGYFGQS